MADYTKFKAYWESIGRPPIEVLINGQQEWLEITNPRFENSDLHYRIKDDPHWELRKKWVDSNFTLPLKMRHETEEKWVICENPGWWCDYEYREMEQKPMTDKPKQYLQRCGRPGGIYEWNANHGCDYPHNGWYQQENGFKQACTFNIGLAFRNNRESPEDLIEVTPYDGIEIDTPGWAFSKDGIHKFKAYFAGIDKDRNPLIWHNGCTSWTGNSTYTCSRFIPKGDDE